MFALDVETTGLDRAHGCQPFYVSVCHDDGTLDTFEWDVDPLTREVQRPDGDLYQVEKLLCVCRGWHQEGGLTGEELESHKVVGHNVIFDSLMLQAIGVECWPWGMTHDMLTAGHVLGSNQPHDLTSMAKHWLGCDIQPLEDALEVAVKAARRVVQQAKLRVRRSISGRGKVEVAYLDEPLADWMIAEEGMPCLPSAKGSEGVWRNDYWLPRALASHEWSASVACQVVSQMELADVRESVGILEEVEGWEWRPPSEHWEGHHPWWTVLGEYASADPPVTLRLWQKLAPELRRRGYWQHYEEKMRVMPILCKMQSGRGVTIDGREMDRIQSLFLRESDRQRSICTRIAEGYGYALDLPKSSNNKSLSEFCFSPDLLNLPVVNRTAKAGNPSIDSKVAIPTWLLTLDGRSKQHAFVRALAAKRKRDTALAFIESYRRFRLPVESDDLVQRVLLDDRSDRWFMWPSINLNSTATLRMSMSCPNGQQISKQETNCEECGGDGCGECEGSGKALLSLRRMFGPVPGREWWSLDYQNVELRIPAYASGEREMIELFERPDDPPYFGSQHLLNAHVVFGGEFESCLDEGGRLDGRIFKKRFPALYGQTKNGDFALQYNCGEVTADRTFKRRGAYRLLKSKFTKLEDLNQRQIDVANKFGYVETMPDREVCPERGYPLLCTRTEWGKVLPTVPLSYFVQGTAMWCTLRAMVRVDAYLEELNLEEPGHRIVLQVHDELVVEMPRRADRGNLGKALEVRRLMEMSGDDIGVPLGVGVEYNPVNWAEGEVVRVQSSCQVGSPVRSPVGGCPREEVGVAQGS